MNPAVTFVGIDGHGGSGKSTLAALLSQELGAEIIHIDDFTGFSSDNNWHIKLKQSVLHPVLAGAKTLSYQPAKWWLEHNPKPVVDQPVTPVMIVEGVGALRAELRPYMKAKIFVNTPRDVCLERGIARDSGAGGKSVSEITALWNTWLDKEEKYFECDAPIEHSDLIADGEVSFDGLVSLVKNIL